MIIRLEGFGYLKSSVVFVTIRRSKRQFRVTEFGCGRCLSEEFGGVRHEPQSQSFVLDE